MNEFIYPDRLRLVQPVETCKISHVTQCNYLFSPLMNLNFLPLNHTECVNGQHPNSILLHIK